MGLLLAAGSLGVYAGIVVAGRVPWFAHVVPALIPALLGTAYGPWWGSAAGVTAALLTLGGMRDAAGWPWPSELYLNWAIGLVLFAGIGAASGAMAHLRYYRAVELAELVRELRRARQVLSALYESGKLITSELELDRLITRLVQLVEHLFGYSHPAILLVDEEADETLRLAGASGYAAPLGTTVRFGEGITGYVARTGLPILVDDVTRDPRYVLGLDGCRSELAVPIRVKGRILGVLNVESPRVGAFTDDDVRVLQSIADQAAVAIQNARLLGLTAQLAVTDGLTELYNHRHFTQQLQIKVERARRVGQPLSVVLIDIDDFKVFNDRFGHLVGDEVLRQLGRLIKQSVRRTDLAARYGGEEFAVLLPDTGTDAAARLAERIQQSLPQAESFLRDLTAGGPPLSLSVGVAAFPEHASTWRQLLERADEACYQAKRAGKNRVVVCSSVPTPDTSSAP